MEPSAHLSPFPPFGTLLKKEVAKSYQFSVCSLYVKARYFSPLYLVSNTNSFASFTKCWSSSFSYYFEPKTLGTFLWQHLCSANLRIGFMPRIIQSLPAPFHSPRLTFQGLISCKFYPGASLQSQKGGNSI